VKRLFSPVIIVLLAIFSLSVGVSSIQAAKVMVPKIDAFTILFDQSGSMMEAYKGEKKVAIAKECLTSINKAIPSLNYQGALKCFAPSQVLVCMEPYSKQKFGEAIADIPTQYSTINRLTTLGDVIYALDCFLAKTQGKFAAIVISDGENTDGRDPIEAAKYIVNKYSDRVCIYTILVGNSPRGTEVMGTIGSLNNCEVTTAEALKCKCAMDSFVEKVFYTYREEVVKPKKIILRDINFDFDKAEIKPEFEPILDEAARILKENPDVRVSIEGHTCSIGTDEYNQRLSERRAQSVLRYLVRKGIDPSRLKATGFGESRPIADNQTKEGRRLNRRAELIGLIQNISNINPHRFTLDNYSYNNAEKISTACLTPDWSNFWLESLKPLPPHPECPAFEGGDEWDSKNNRSFLRMPHPLGWGGLPRRQVMGAGQTVGIRS